MKFTIHDARGSDRNLVVEANYLDVDGGQAAPVLCSEDGRAVVWVNPAFTRMVAPANQDALIELLEALDLTRWRDEGLPADLVAAYDAWKATQQ